VKVSVVLGLEQLELAEQAKLQHYDSTAAQTKLAV
jgi:hypothetical protein